jgi:two-component system LytT family sensor kinase
MKRSYRQILFHLLFWLLYAGWQILQYAWDNKDYIHLEYSPDIWIDLLMSIVLVYINLYLLVPKFFYPKKYLRYGLTLLGCLLIGGVYSRFAGWYYLVPWTKAHDYTMYIHEPTNFFIPIRIIRNTLGYCPVVGLTLFLKLIQDAYAREQRMRALEEEKHQAELDLLKAQVHPHFFFNTLNSLYALTMVKSDKGPEVVLQLSELMHYVLYEANAPLVSLDTEISHLRNYIEIEQLRFGDRLDLRFDTPPDHTTPMVVPLLLLPFIENAFKHSLSRETEKAWIHIDISLQQDALCMKVTNSCHGAGEIGNQTGIGLKNVRKRLELSYPGQHQLDIRPGNDIFEVNLKLSLYAKDPLRNS